MTELTKEDTHLLLKTFFQEKGLVRQHLDSYNEFIDHGLQEVVDEVGEIPIEVPESPYKVKLGQIWVIDPQSRITGPYATEVDGTKHEIYPMEGRLRNLAYAAPIALEMTPVIDGREQDTELVYIGNIPVMLKSKLCFLSQLSREELIAAGEDQTPLRYSSSTAPQSRIVAWKTLHLTRYRNSTKKAPHHFTSKIFSTPSSGHASNLNEIDDATSHNARCTNRNPFVVIMRHFHGKKTKTSPKQYPWTVTSKPSSPSFEESIA